MQSAALRSHNNWYLLPNIVHDASIQCGTNPMQIDRAVQVLIVHIAADKCHRPAVTRCFYQGILYSIYWVNMVNMSKTKNVSSFKNCVQFML